MGAAIRKPRSPHSIFELPDTDSSFIPCETANARIQAICPIADPRLELNWCDASLLVGLAWKPTRAQMIEKERIKRAEHPVRCPLVR